MRTITKAKVEFYQIDLPLEEIVIIIKKTA